MVDSMQTVRPNAEGVAIQGTWTNVGGATNRAVALADDSDSTYVEGVGTIAAAQNFVCSFGTFTLPAGAIVRQVIFRVRASAPVIFSTYPRMGATVACTVDGDYRVNGTAVGNSGPVAAAITTYTFPAVVGKINTQADLDLLTLNINRFSSSTTSTTLRMYEWYADVYYNQISVASAVTLTNLGSATPTVSWTYSDPESDAQTSYQVKVFRTSQADPTVAGALWDSGEVSSAATSAVTGPIDAGTIFAYVRTKDAGSSNWSAWASATGTVAFTAVAAPTALAAVADNAGARVHVTATYAAPGGTYTAPKGTVERSADGGTTWYHVRIAGVLYPNGYPLPSTPYNLDIYDYEAPPGVALQYRVRELASNGAFTVTSAYRTVS